jgi:ribose transport system permease protein
MTGSVQRWLVETVLDHLVWFLLVVVLVTFSLFVPKFFQVGIFANIIEQSTFVGVMAIGLAIVVIAGHMDLSVESVAALSAMAVGILFCARGIGVVFSFTPSWLNIPASLAVAFGVGGLSGLINGCLVVRV